MAKDETQTVAEPLRADVDNMKGPVLLEFGAAWCGHCRALAPQISAALEDLPKVKHIKVEDGPGQPLGRSFRVKLWPTLVFLKDGQVLAQLVRPNIAEVRKSLDLISDP